MLAASDPSHAGLGKKLMLDKKKSIIPENGNGGRS